MRRSAVPWVILAILALLVTVPAVEITVFVLLANAIGAVWALVALVATSLVGIVLLRREGLRGWRSVRSAAQAGRTPAREAVEGIAAFLGALLVLLPGFVTDLIGILLVVPAVHRRVATMTLSRFATRLPPGMANDLIGPMRVKARRGRGQRDTPQDPPPSASPSEPPAGQGKVIEGEIE